jgi:hypothetical protein
MAHILRSVPHPELPQRTQCFKLNTIKNTAAKQSCTRGLKRPYWRWSLLQALIWRPGNLGHQNRSCGSLCRPIGESFELQNRKLLQPQLPKPCNLKSAPAPKSGLAQRLSQTSDKSSDRRNAAHSITIAWSSPLAAGALRSSRTSGIAASERIIISLKSLM